MAEIVIGIGAKVVECLAGPILDRACYLFRFKKFIGELKEAEDVLKKRLEEVKERIKKADRNGEDIMLPVTNWLEEVETILKDVHEFQRKVEEEGQRCFNVSLRYSLAKQMDNKAKRMAKLKEESHFEEDSFSCLAPLPGITYFSSKDFEDFKSRESTYKNLLEVIKNGKKKMVGLYGMGGSGKTTLAKEVGKKVYKAKSFEKVIMVVVSKPPNVVKIQREIAEKIDLKFQEETQSVRAQRLSKSLENKKILIILDDVWEYLNLEDIGIKDCHILLTTRLRNVCSSMGCETIQLPLIAREEAWELFKKHANLCNDSSDMFEDVGRKIVDECKELPIAIVVVGRSLKRKDIGAWKSALRRLERSQPLNVEGDSTNVNTCLELSYDGLSSSTAKLLFLLCSMFPEDHEIHKEDLIRFGKRTLELEESIVTMEDARREILDALNILLDSCLLMSIDKEAYVKMHDLVRDVALCIAKKQRQAILVDKNVLSNMMISSRQSLKDTKALSLWNLDGNFNLYDQLHCSTLEILLLQPHGSIKDLGAIEALKVLAIIEDGFKWGRWWWHDRPFCSIPQSIVSLTNLHTLCLRWTILGNISLLGELKGLEILDLRGSSFDELPVGIVDMKMLKLLDIYNCEIEKSPLAVIGRCEQLEELYFWDGNSIIPKNFSLSGLKRYVLYDSTCSIMGVYANYPFREFLDSCDEALRALCIQGFRVFTLNSSMKDLIHRANHLWLDNCRWDHKDINLNIKHLGVSCCQEKRFIIENRDRNTLQAQVFSHLITLRLFEMNSLEQVFQDSSMSCSLPMLQEVRIRSCPELRTCIFSHNTIMSLPKLRKLEIDGCNKVKWLLSYSLACRCPSLEQIAIQNCSEVEKLIDEEDAHGNPLLHDMQYYPHGNETDRAHVGVTANISNVCFPKLREIVISDCNKVRWLLSYSLASHCPSLEAICIYDCSEFERLIDEEVTDGDSLLHGMQDYSYQPLVLFPNLKEISIEDCHKVRWLLSYSLASLHCPSLETIWIENCSEIERLVEGASCGDQLPLLKLKTLRLFNLPRLREIFRGEFEYKLESFPDKQKNSQYKHENDIVRVVNSELCSIWLQGLPELEYIWKGPTQILSLHRLEDIRLFECPKLRNMFTLAIVTSLPELKKIKVIRCEEWEGIFCEESLKNLSTSSIVCFPKLESICIRRCHKLRRVFTYSLASHCPSLEEITIWNCCQLEGVVEAYEGEEVAAHHQSLFPKLNLLELSKLPKLREIYPGYEFNHLFDIIQIEDCPNICNIPLEDKASSSALEIKLES